MTPESTVRLHELAIRQDGSETIAGRIDTGEFVALPKVGALALDLLAAGMTMRATAERLARETGEQIDVLEFAEELLALRFIAVIDGHPVGVESGPAPQTLPWLRQRQVQWLLHPACHLTVAAVIATAVLLVVVGLAPVPGYRSLMWTNSGSLVVLGQLTMAWGLIVVHELAHLATARAAGVPGRVRLSTRLQFLVAQTDVSGIWAAPRRHRLTVYAAGMASDATIASLALLVSAATPAGSTAHRLAGALVATVLMKLPIQLLIFMRTDVYFIFQDLARCRDLYSDGGAYARYLAKRITRTGRSVDPSVELPHRERRIVRCYASMLVVGTAVCLGVLVVVTVPFEAHLVADAVRAIGSGAAGHVLDGAVVLAVLGGFHLLWGVAWWRRHGHRLRTVFTRRRPAAARAQ